MFGIEGFDLVMASGLILGGISWPPCGCLVCVPIEHIHTRGLLPDFYFNIDQAVVGTGN
jgi:hypothetical protein